MIFCKIIIYTITPCLTQRPVLLELTTENASEYLGSRLEASGARDWRIVSLGGGVSNTVLLAESKGRRWVIKQSLGKLRVEEEWLADRSRIHREAAAMKRLAPVLPLEAVPEIVFTDEANCIYAMAAAAEGARDWKSHLLEGDVDPGIGCIAGSILSAQIGATWESEECRKEFGDLRCFDQLRLDPYYRFLARRHTDLAPAMEKCIALCQEHRYCLVHGDFSPKNLLVRGEVVTVIDFEVIHYGNPAFDAAFLIHHLLLKSVHRPEWGSSYADTARWFWNALIAGYPGEAEQLRSDTMQHLGCLFLARVDGKSPAEYLTPAQRERVRVLARGMIQNRARDVEEAFGRVLG